MSLEQSLGTFVPGPAQSREAGNKEDLGELTHSVLRDPNNGARNRILHISKTEFNGTKSSIKNRN